MADAGRIATNVVFAGLALLLVALVALGLMYLFAPGEEYGEESQMQKQTGQQPDAAREAIAASDSTGSAAAGHPAPENPEGLKLATYDLDTGARVVSGTVVNESNKPYVNVQVGFELLRADNTRLATIRDTAREVDAGASWSFRIPLPANTAPEEVRNTDLSGGAKSVTGAKANPPTNQDAQGDSVGGGLR